MYSYVSDRPFPEKNASTLSVNLSSSISYQPVQKTFSANVANVSDQTDPATEPCNLSNISDWQAKTIPTSPFIVSKVTNDKKQEINTFAYHWTAQEIRPFPKAGERVAKRKSPKENVLELWY